jgi:signal transduction histidine kinase
MYLELIFAYNSLVDYEKHECFSSGKNRIENRNRYAKFIILIALGVFFYQGIDAQPPDLFFSRSLAKIQLSGDNCNCIAQESNILFSVKDFGVGMEPGKASSIFAPGTNTSSVGTDGEKGTGLGLFLCSKFVLKHQGKIWAESKPGEGTFFFFTIPTPPELYSLTLR